MTKISISVLAAISIALFFTGCATVNPEVEYRLVDKPESLESKDFDSYFFRKSMLVVKPDFTT
jgi:PBP1b-binding outer membrane lipoprotein LpoB